MPSPDWDAYVAAHPSATVYAASGWSQVAHSVFGHDAHFFEARNAAGQLVGVLPLVRQRSLLLGDFLTSVPFFNYGGAVADSQDIARALMEAGAALGKSFGCRYVEFRDVDRMPGEWTVRTDKVSMVRELPADTTQLGKQLGSKLRSQIKRAERENPEVKVGGAELASEFYDVFAENMRDLGTPVYPVRFFRALLDRFPEQCVLVVIRCAGRPAAAGFLVLANGIAEIPWAACRAQAKPLGMNMRLYWESLSLAVERGCREFDFGRSTVDSGTFKFKAQWGAQPKQLHWHRWERNASRSTEGEAHSRGDAMTLASRMWQRLPLSVANSLGPLISPKLPW
jgi:serine/alanine adding enzyme